MKRMGRRWDDLGRRVLFVGTVTNGLKSVTNEEDGKGVGWVRKKEYCLLGL